MKQEDNIHHKIDALVGRHKKFRCEAYYFVLGALDFTLSRLKKPRHVTGKELLEGVRQFGQEQYGRMCLTVFNHWGITETEHFGEIVLSWSRRGYSPKPRKTAWKTSRGCLSLKRRWTRNRP